MREIIYISLHCHHQNDSCTKMGSDESHFNVSLTVRGKVTRQCPQTTTFLKRKESQSRVQPRSFCLPLGQTGSRPDKSCEAIIHTPSIAFRHLPPNSARFSDATEGVLFISAQLSSDAVSALRKVRVLTKLQALVYDILPSTTAVFSYATESRKMSANDPFFVGAQTVLSLLQTTQIISHVCFITDHVA